MIKQFVALLTTIALLLTATGCGSTQLNETSSNNVCTECGKPAQTTYNNPFSNQTEYYCSEHYYELENMINEIGLN